MKRDTLYPGDKTFSLDYAQAFDRNHHESSELMGCGVDLHPYMVKRQITLTIFVFPQLEWLVRMEHIIGSAGP